MICTEDKIAEFQKISDAIADDINDYSDRGICEHNRLLENWANEVGIDENTVILYKGQKYRISSIRQGAYSDRGVIYFWPKVSMVMIDTSGCDTEDGWLHSYIIDLKVDQFASECTISDE